MDELIRSEVYDSRLPQSWASVRHWTTLGQKRMQKRERTAWEQQKYKMKNSQKQCQERDPDSQQKALLFEIEYPEAQFGAHDGHGPETEPTCILKQ